MRKTDMVILAELERWSRNRWPWVSKPVLQELVGLRERHFQPALLRLLVDKKIEISTHDGQEVFRSIV